MTTPVRLSYFYLFYFFIYMGNAVYGTFIPLYFRDAGFDSSQIGILLGIGPLVAIFAQPVWGTLSDRAKTKNTILLLLIAGSGGAMLLYPLSDGFGYLLGMISIFTFFQASIFALSDAITLEELDRHRWAGGFSRIRLAGTLGFALMSIAFGLIAEKRVDLLFAVYAMVMAVSFMFVLRFPSVVGHQTDGRRIRIWILFRNRKLVFYLAVNFVLHITLGYYYSFFPLYFQELGGSNAWLGWSMVISSLSEVPFLLLAGKIFQRVRIHYILFGAGIAAALRWYLLSAIHDPYWTIPVQVLHGLIFIVLSVTMATVINREVPDELKASGQTLNALLCLGVARLIGSYAGGEASEIWGMRDVFMYNAVLAIGCIVVFAVLFRRMDGRSTQST
ncbi:MFS transporter [Cohnella sp. JJ-181]|uniref:MFS transporter n=1 Tax=Cohnella rhizoplanae TaxID=2974897 RepID=UPI0022FF70EB|nr:MFS transporter [Cohnella sp. JJ-181]CAI6077738.1 Putative nucleoside transporter YegT [Cohnella sp. JJ-181]